MHAILKDSQLADRRETKHSLRERILGRRNAVDPKTRPPLSGDIVKDNVGTSAYRRSDAVMG